MKYHKGFVPVAVVIIIAVLAIGFIGVAIYYETQKDDVENIPCWERAAGLIGGDKIDCEADDRCYLRKGASCPECMDVVFTCLEVDGSSIINFEECIEAGNPAMESYPRQCIADGKTFIEVIINVNTNTNTNTISGGPVQYGECGDGICDSGENTSTYPYYCPEDCIKTNTVLNTNTVIDETDDWQTYINNEYEYSFQYSSDWTIEVSEYDASPFSSDVVIINNLLDESVLHICPDSRGMSCVPFQDGQWDSKKSDIIVGNTQAEEEVYVFSGPEDCSTCTTRSLISFSSAQDGWKENGQFMLVPASGGSFDELKKILRTFKFTN
ncbi:MAG: hypothetical protein ACNFW9_00570 [Candidatus Kerfeldbacteria bacterium]